MNKVKDNTKTKTNNKVGDNNMKLYLAVQNNSSVEFGTDGGSTSSGGIVKHIPILALQLTSNAVTGSGTSGTMTGLVGNASWNATMPNGDEVKLTLDFSIPFDGGNSGSLSGDTNFKKYFKIDPNISMPDGDSANLSATINPK